MKKEQPISGYALDFYEVITTSQFTKQRGSYFFMLLSIIIRSNFTIKLIKVIINVRIPNMIIPVS